MRLQNSTSNFYIINQTYSITMNPAPHSSLPCENTACGDKTASQNHAGHYPLIVYAEVGCAAAKSEVMENVDKTAGCIQRQQEQSGRFCRGPFPIKIAFVAVTLFEFALLFALILIQYISCQIQRPIFFIAAASLLILHALLVTLAATIKIAPACPSQHKLSLKPFKKKRSASEKSEQGIPTVPKINEAACQRGNAKTKKLKRLHSEQHPAENSELTLRGNFEEEYPYDGLFSVKKNVVVVLKPMQAIFQLVAPSVSLALTYPDITYSQSLLAISLTAYLLTPVSLLLFCLFLRGLRSALHPQVLHEPHLRSQEVAQGQPMTRVSIEQMILHAKSCETHSVTLEKDPRSPNNDGKSQPDRKIVPFVRRQQVKKSVLKSSKTQGFRSRKASEDEEGIERRKVEFNSKKLQCFEYLQITPPHSTVEEESSNKKLSECVKGSGQRLKYLHHRLENEAQILRNKAKKREGRTKSLGEARNQPASLQKSAVFNKDPFC